MPDPGANLWVFRDGRRAVSGRALVERLGDDLRALPPDLGSQSSDAVIAALLSAGELECALADAGSRDAPLAGSITDALAARGAGSMTVPPCAHTNLAHKLETIAAPAELCVSTPEGFAFYALHPLDYGAAAQRLPQSAFAAVVGIRSIGTTLGAVVAAALAKRGTWAERISVRPAGHPFDRHCEFSRDQLRWIAAQRARRAEFVVVDEGPGLSGTSLLSVGEALVGAGVPRAAITFLGAHQPNLSSLVGRDAAARWQGFRFLPAGERTCLPEHAADIGGGAWRRMWFRNPAAYPPSWTHMERIKLLTAEARSLWKFQGLGRYGQAVVERERTLADAGFAVPPGEEHAGFVRYPVVSFEPLSREEWTPALIRRMGEYCAFRAAELPARSCTSEPLESMVRTNLKNLFGIEADFPDGLLAAPKPMFADGRMMPHEWVRSANGVLKCDSGAHGDDHFFPGPTDIAWDLAGAIVEWSMDDAATAALLESYHHAAGDDPRPRLPAFLLAYSVFRAAYCSMAAHAMRGSDEHARLTQAAGSYASRARQLLADFVDDELEQPLAG